MTTELDLQEFQKDSIGVFCDNVRRGLELVPEEGLTECASVLRREFGLDVMHRELGRCVTIAFLKANDEADGTVAVPALNAIQYSGQHSVFHRDTATLLGRQANADYLFHWSGYAWNEKPLKILVLVPRVPEDAEKYLNAFHTMAAMTMPVTSYHCWVPIAPSTKHPPNVQWTGVRKAA